MLLLLIPVRGAGEEATAVTVRLPVVPVRISQVVAQFQWSATVNPPSSNVFVIEGSVMDDSDSLSIRQETILPGVILDDAPPVVVLGLQWLWNNLRSGDLEIHVLQPGYKPVPYRSIGIDERIGLLLIEPAEGAKPPSLRRMEVRLNPPGVLPADTRLLCVPGEQAFQIVAARAGTGRSAHQLTPLTRAPLPPLLLPVLSLDGDFSGFCYPVAPPPESSRKWKLIDSGDIRRRVEFIAENRINIQPGYLGVFLGDRMLADGRSQVYIRGVVPHSPSDVAGLRPGDVVRSISGDPVSTAREMVNRLRQFSPNTRIAMNILRDGESFRPQAILAKRPADPAPARRMSMDALQQIMANPSGQLVLHPEGAPGAPALSSLRSTGVFIKTPSPQLLAALGQDGTAGALVTYVLPGFPAAQAGLQAGDLIMELNGRPVRSAEDITLGLKEIPRHDPIVLRFSRRGETRQVTLPAR
ncbi:MAG: PDZ domain-containing protein [Acidobacteria bacterium]|nr:PDZ domain-containing protein [Acidobacteriota bacterium]